MTDIGGRLVGSIIGTVVCGVLLVSAARAETPLERGRYLMKSVVACGNCHTPQTPAGPNRELELAGGFPIVEPGVFTAYASNITPDIETGIGGWSDAEIIRAIRDGVRPDGSIIGPPMPIEVYRGLSDADARAIVAYLRSIPAIKRETPPSEYSFPLPPSYGPPVGVVPEVARDDAVAWGGYLAGPLGHCTACHSTPGAKGVPDLENELGGGGATFHGPWGESVAANITPTGLGDWSDAQIITAVTQGVRPDGRRLKPPMAFAYYRTIAPGDLRAIVAYLRSLPEK
ncbi:MAG: c-type cytochrome [Alphaproteobacteria bacterium]|nr:c-type cytochrome [Alphaproteobacteria bacterium]